MVILKKVRASTLMETLVATVLIVIVFMMASLILNNVFGNHIKNEQYNFRNQFNELQYLYLSDKIALPYYEDKNNWEFSLEYIKEEKNHLLFKAVNKETLKAIQYSAYDRQ